MRKSPLAQFLPRETLYGSPLSLSQIQPSANVIGYPFNLDGGHIAYLGRFIDSFDRWIIPEIFRKAAPGLCCRDILLYDLNAVAIFSVDIIDSFIRRGNSVEEA